MDLSPSDFEEGEIENAYESGVDPYEFITSKLSEMQKRDEDISGKEETDPFLFGNYERRLG